MKKHLTIFLDVDGVLTSEKQLKKYVEEHGAPCPPGKAQLDPGCISTLASIVRNHDAQVVISSTWRKLPSDMFDLMQVFSDYGIPVVGMTPSSASGNRGEEISAYMSIHELGLRDILIIDDSSEDLKGFESRLLKTITRTGLDQLTDIHLADNIVYGEHVLIILSDDDLDFLEEMEKYLKTEKYSIIFNDQLEWIIDQCARSTLEWRSSEGSDKLDISSHVVSKWMIRIMNEILDAYTAIRICDLTNNAIPTGPFMEDMRKLRFHLDNPKTYNPDDFVCP